jgi:DUF177 domain-containing protein
MTKSKRKRARPGPSGRDRATPRDTLTVNVASLLAEPGGSVRDHAFDDVELDLGDDLTLARPADARFRLTRTNRGLLVDGDVRATLAETCSRCLRPIEVDVAQDIDEEALPIVDLATGAPLDHADEPEVARLTRHHEIELEPFLREAILLAEPIAPLCRPDCPGLCPECGEELSSGPHDHGEAPIDPRLEALRAFRVDADDETA